MPTIIDDDGSVTYYPPKKPPPAERELPYGVIFMVLLMLAGVVTIALTGG